MKVTETCSCGASITIDDRTSISSSRLDDWRKGHRHELAPPPAETTEQRDSDHTGYVLDAGDTTTGLGFVGPGPKVDEAWEEQG